MSQQLLVHEIFSSIQGESRFIGYPTTFVRLYGCNLACTWCDEGYGEYYKDKFKDRPRIKMTPEEIVHDVTKRGYKHVCLTGGEPLLNSNAWVVIYELVAKGYIVSIETNGSIPLKDDRSNRSFVYVMDFKMPASGMNQRMHLPNLKILTAKDDLKFVIGNREDYEYARDIIREYQPRAVIHFSPVVEEDATNMGHELSQWILEDNLNVRLTLQMHRYVGWGHTKEGVK